MIIMIIIQFKINPVCLCSQTRVYKDKADNCGPVHITIGDGGNREGLATK